MDGKRYTVGDVARMAHVTVRTLHHYDAIGLLAPSARSATGYRLYTDADLRRLHQILLFRELDFPLEAIRGLLDAPAFDRRTALRAQRELLTERVRRAEAVLRAVDEALRAIEEGREMETTKLFDGFDAFDHARYEEEARERWGETGAYRESVRRTRRYTKEDWARYRAEADALVARWAEQLAAGRRPDEREVADIAEEHRLHIDRWFYPCDHATHRGLAGLYTGDPRFAAYYDRHAPGLAAYVAASIRANAARAGVAGDAC